MGKVIDMTPAKAKDIPSQLHALADFIKDNPDEAEKVIVITVVSDPAFYPNIYAYGERIEGKAEIVYNLEAAKQSLLNLYEPR